MFNKEWPADDYAIGSYIQSTVADLYLANLNINPTDAVLDIGCGNGAYSLKIIKQFPMASFLGLDASASMLALARKDAADYRHVSFQEADMLNMKFENQFDSIISFWCLQWASNIQIVFENIYNALKPGGRILTIFPTGDDPLMNTYKIVKQSGKFKELDEFKPPVNYQQMENLEDKLGAIPFKNLKIERHPQMISLPSLDIFRKFVTAIPFFQGKIPVEKIKEINDAMINAFAIECQKKYHGELQFEFTTFYVTAEK